jgi:hypothetical protein
MTAPEIATDLTPYPDAHADEPCQDYFCPKSDASTCTKTTLKLFVTCTANDAGTPPPMRRAKENITAAGIKNKIRPGDSIP